MLDEPSATFLASMAESGLPPLHELTPRAAREAGARMAELYGRGPEMARVQDVELGRLFVPNGRARGVIVYYHGGGWVLGSPDQFDALARRLAAGTGCAVVLVDYRLAPEHRYPAAVDDAWTALEWTAANLEQIAGRPVPLIVAGDSAGGCLAAVVAQRAREAGPEIALQVLVYPVTDCDLDRDSYLEPENQLIVGRDTMAWFWDLYAPDPAVRSRPDASPLRATDLAGLPPAVVLTAQYDPLRDEGEAYAERLAAGGRPRRAPALRRPDAQLLHARRPPAGQRRRARLRRAGDRPRAGAGPARRDRRRRRLRRPVRAPPPARSRVERARPRAGRGDRRHVVLEPLSRRPLRHRVDGLLVLVLGGARAGVGVERALSDPAGDPALPQPRRRPLRPAPRHPAEHARRRGALRRRALGGHDGTTAPGTRRPTASWPPGACRRCTGLRSRGSTTSRATGTTPRAGRRTASTSPASASA